MLEAELFGWEKGAFSGAHTSNIGLFARADGGTLFLDEIGDLPLSLQPKLLRVLQNGMVRPLDKQKERSINIRIIAATHRDLETHVATGQFRADFSIGLRFSLFTSRRSVIGPKIFCPWRAILSVAITRKCGFRSKTLPPMPLPFCKPTPGQETAENYATLLNAPWSWQTFSILG
jgi:hypothetical protein